MSVSGRQWERGLGLLVRMTVAAATLTVASTATSAAPTVTPVVIASFPHDPAAFTQGLLLHGDDLIESTGLFGESTLRRVDRASGDVLNAVALPDDQFGEGIALVGGRIIQLTYDTGIAYVRDVTSFQELARHSYDGQGWGICHDGRRLIMSDGSDRLVFRDPETFAVIGGVNVTESGRAYSQLNELECVAGEVWANVWQTDYIVRIDPESGEVLSKVFAGELLTPDQAPAAGDLNGIAYDPSTDHFLLTGKLWPAVYEVQIERATSPATAPSASSSSCALPEPAAADRGYGGPIILVAAVGALTRRRRR